MADKTDDPQPQGPAEVSTQAPAVVDRLKTPSAGRQAGYVRVTQPLRTALRRIGEWHDRLPAVFRALIIAATIALAAAVPFILPRITADSTYWTSVLTKAGIATLLALGLNVVVGFAGLLDLGYVAFFAVGAYS